MAELEQDRSEPATPHKLDQARQRGTVAKSLEVSSLLALLTLAAVAALDGRDAVLRQLQLDARLLDLSGRVSAGTFEAANAVPLLAWAGGQALAVVLPLMLALVAVAIVGGLVQAGGVFSVQAVKPDIDRINPAAGFKRLFSLRLVFETVKNIVKLLLFGLALWWLFGAGIGVWLGLAQASPARLLGVLLADATAIVWKLAAIVAFVAVIDWLFTRWHWRDRLRMSRRELRDELKHREGDPRIRTRMRQLREEMLKRAKAMRRIGDADVLITNPTHLAVALRYRRETMSAPELVAKGSGELVQQMKALARRHRVPVVQNPTLARALFDGAALDAAIPEALYPPVARLLVWLNTLREARA